MDIFGNLQNLLGQGSAPGGKNRNAGGADILSGLFNPTVLNGIASALTSKSGKGGGQNSANGLASLLGAFLGSGGGDLLGALTGGASGISATQPERPANAHPVNVQPTNHSPERLQRLLRAMIYAAKCDGHIDEKEADAINTQIQKFGIGANSQAIVQQIMAESPDPARVAKGVTDPQEAMQLYVLSCAVIDIDQFMERNYMDALAAHLNIPAQTKTAIENRLKQ